MSRPIRLAMLAGLLAVLVAAFFSPYGPQQPLAFLLGEGRQSTSESPARQQPNNATPNQWQARVAASYRLPPDARFTDAINRVRPDQTVVPSWDSNAGAWRLDWDDGSASLSPDTGFNALYSALRKAVPETDELSSSSSDELGIALPQLLDALPEASQSQPAQNPAAARRTARIAARILLVQEDKIGLLAPLAARALANLAVAEAAGADLSLARSMIAWSLDYRAYARALAEASLGQQHPWRAYVQRRVETLASPETPLAHYLKVRAAAHWEHDGGAWTSAARWAEMNGVDPVAIYQTTFVQEEFRPRTAAMIALPGLIVGLANGEDLDDLSTYSPAQPSGMAHLIGDTRDALEDFENGSSGLAWPLDQPPVSGLEDALDAVDRPQMANALRAAFYTPIILRAETHLEPADPSEPVSRLADQIGKLEAHPAPAVATFLRHRAAIADVDSSDPAELIDAARTLPLAPGLRRALLAGALDLIHQAPLDPLTAFRRFARLDDPPKRAKVTNNRTGRALDARPDDQAIFRAFASKELHWPLLTEDLRERLVAQRGPAAEPRLALEQAKASNSRQALERLAANKTVGVVWRARALAALVPAGSGASAFESFAALAEAHPRKWTVRQVWVEALLAEGQAQEALRVTREWRQAEHEDVPQADRIDARIAQIQSLLRLGRTAAAVKLADETLNQTDEAPAYQAAIGAYQQHGQDDRALKLAQELAGVDRPDVADILPLVRRQWCRGAIDQGAETLLETREYPLGHETWASELPPIMADCFSDQPEAAAQATRVLQAKGAEGDNLDRLAEGLSQQGFPQIAFHVAKTATRERSFTQASLRVEAAAYRLTTGNVAETLQWAKQTLPENLKSSLSRTAYGSGGHELLWEVTPAPKSPQKHYDYVWAMRAASIAVGRTASSQRREQTVAALEQAGDTVHAAAARMLLGETTKEQLADKPMPRTAVATAAYYLGVNAAAQDQPERALAWYTVSEAAGAGNTWMDRWARGILERIQANPTWRLNYQEQGAEYLMPWGSASAAN